MTPPRAARPFASFFLGGFECSSHKRLDGTRLDLLSSTGHADHAARDYACLAEHGIRAARDGLRWHLIERTPGRYDWSSLEAQLRAAHATGTQILWDLCHYGLPERPRYLVGRLRRPVRGLRRRRRAGHRGRDPVGPLLLPGQRDLVLGLGRGRGRALQPGLPRPRRGTEAPARSGDDRGRRRRPVGRPARPLPHRRTADRRRARARRRCPPARRRDLP